MAEKVQEIEALGPAKLRVWAVNDPGAAFVVPIDKGTRIQLTDAGARLWYPSGSRRTIVSSMVPILEGEALRSRRFRSFTGATEWQRLHNAIATLAACEPKRSPLVRDWERLRTLTGWRAALEAVPFGVAEFAALEYYWRRYRAAVAGLKAAGWWARHCTDLPEPGEIEPTLIASANDSIERVLTTWSELGERAVDAAQDAAASALKRVSSGWWPVALLGLAGTGVAIYAWRKGGR